MRPASRTAQEAVQRNGKPSKLAPKKAVKKASATKARAKTKNGTGESEIGRPLLGLIK